MLSNHLHITSTPGALNDASNPLVSIVIPVYNSEKFVRETLLSALQQTYTNTEIIVVDDGSTDGSFEIINTFKSPKLTILRQENRGASAARNYGISAARGAYVQFLDADDILHPDKIRIQVNTSKQYGERYLIGCLWRRFDHDVCKAFSTIPAEIKVTGCFDRVDWLIRRPYMVPHTWLVPVTLIQTAGTWDERLSFNDDGEFFYRVIAASAGIVVDTEAVVFYRSGNTMSLSKRRDREAVVSWIESIKSYKRILHQLAGDRGNESVNSYFYEIRYNCINKFPDLEDWCAREMYHPEKIYNLSDTLVFNLARLVGLQNAKKVRQLLNLVRETALARFIIYRVKAFLKMPSY